MSDNTISLNLTEKEAELLWDLVMAERHKIQRVAGFGSVIPTTGVKVAERQEERRLRATPDILKLCKSIHEKIDAAAKDAGGDSG